MSRPSTSRPISAGLSTSYQLPISRSPPQDDGLLLSRPLSHPASHRPGAGDNQARRLNSWGVFGAVMDPNSFSRTMSDDEVPGNLSGNDGARLRKSRVCSPDRIVSPESLSVIDSVESDPEQEPHPPLVEQPILCLSASHPAPTENAVKKLRRTSFKLPQWIFSKLPSSFQKDFRVILKCSIAYFIASLFSFYDPLSDLLVLPFGLKGPFSGAHVVATIVTYYTPAATVGGMMQANHYALWGTFWLAVLVVGSTFTSVMIENRVVSHAIVLIVFIGVGYGIIGWVKQKSPGFSTTCSMIATISSVIITREGSIHFGYLDFKKSLIYSEIVMIAMIISNMISLGFWRGSATNKLQCDINNTLDSFSTLIGMLTKTFLLDETIYTNQDQLKKAIDSHHASFTSLKKSLVAASYEFFEPRIQRSQSSYQELVGSMNRLAQHLTGLRSGCSLQYEIMETLRYSSLQTDASSIRSCASRLSAEELPTIKRVFVTFCDKIGPSLKNLMATSVACLHEIKTSGHVPRLSKSRPVDELGHGGVESIMQMRDRLLSALEAFEQSHSQAMKELYHDFCQKSGSISFSSGVIDSTLRSEMSQPNEEIFVICFFLFNMEEFMRELCKLLDIFADIRTDEEFLVYEFMKRRMSIVKWFKFGHWQKSKLDPAPRPGPRRQRPRLTAVLPRDPRRHDPFPMDQSSPKKGRGEQNKSLLDTSYNRMKRTIYDFAQELNDPETRTAIKIGAGAAILSLPAFLDATRPLFHEYRGQWTVVTYMIVVASTLGQTNFLVTMRILGTLIGSGVAIIAYHLFWEDPVALPVIGFFFSIPCYWLITSQPKFISTGRFLLLSYNLVCLYSYNVRDDNVHILVTAYRRVICVLVGVLFGWAVNNLVWPYKARSELRKCLSGFLLECAFLYSFLVKRYNVMLNDQSGDMAESPIHEDIADDRQEQSPLLSDIRTNDNLKSAMKEFSKMELFLQVKLIRLLDLLAVTRHEPRLKGPFPSGRYLKMLNACQSLLDMLHSLKSVTEREAWSRTIKRDFLNPVQTEHRELVGNVLLYFGLLSTSIESKSPLPPYLPPASQARERLLRKIRGLPIISEFSVVSNEDDHDFESPKKEKDSDYLLFFAFMVAMRNVIRELEIIGLESQDLFGIIGGVKSLDEFESIFQ